MSSGDFAHPFISYCQQFGNCHGRRILDFAPGSFEHAPLTAQGSIHLKIFFFARRGQELPRLHDQFFADFAHLMPIRRTLL